MVVIAATVAILSAVIYISLVARLTENGIYYVAGYNAWVDLFFTIFVIGVSAATGSVTGLLISAFTGVALTVMLIFLKRYTGGLRFKRQGFKFVKVVVPPTHKLPKALSFLSKFITPVDVKYAAV